MRYDFFALETKKRWQGVTTAKITKTISFASQCSPCQQSVAQFLTNARVYDHIKDIGSDLLQRFLTFWWLKCTDCTLLEYNQTGYEKLNLENESLLTSNNFDDTDLRTV